MAQAASERRLPQTYVAPHIGSGIRRLRRSDPFRVEPSAGSSHRLAAHFSQSDQGVEALELGSRQGGLTVSRIELFRDVYYLTRPASSLVAAPASAGPDRRTSSLSWGTIVRCRKTAVTSVRFTVRLARGWYDGPRTAARGRSRQPGGARQRNGERTAEPTASPRTVGDDLRTLDGTWPFRSDSQ